MKATSRLLSAVLTAFFLISLSACGGGGGGEDAGITPIAYTGSTTLATIDGTNAGDLAALAENGAALFSQLPIPMPASEGENEDVNIPVPVIQAIIDLGKKVPGYLDGAPGSASPAAVYTQTETEYCGIGDESDGSMTMTTSINDVTYDMSVSITYNNCDEGFGVVMNGGMAVSANMMNEDPTDAPITINMRLNNLEMYFQDDGSTITIYAVVSMTEDLTGANPVMIMNFTDMIIQGNAIGLTTRISNYDITVTEYTDYEEITIAAMARVYDYDLGYVEFYTLTPIKEDPLTGPFEGIVRIEGANDTWAEVDFADTDGDGYLGTFGDISGHLGTFGNISGPE